MIPEVSIVPNVPVVMSGEIQKHGTIGTDFVVKK
jgi:hypothetical protein